MKRFGAVCTCTFQQEISKYNKDEADKMKKEMKEMYDNLNKDHQKMIEKLEKELEKMAEEEVKRKERRKRRAYNPRFAEKNCWHCGEAGHLIYWCPDFD